jgi:excisionase family DNA binding protein
MAEDWMTTAEAAEVSGYHPEHLRELIREGKISGRKFGPVWQIKRQSLLSYVESAKKRDDKRWGPKE